MNPNPLEKDIESKVVSFARSMNVLAYKFTSPAKRSVPDRLFVMPGGRGCFFMELKRRGQKPTPSQQVEIDKIRAQGVSVFVVDNVEEGKKVIREKLDLLEGY